jgi:hypothetical protein
MEILVLVVLGQLLRSGGGSACKMAMLQFTKEL